ncbi:hypothetical protein UT5_20570 [Ferrigenium sp. UT5]
MLRIPRQSYTEELKREAVKLVEGGIKPAQMDLSRFRAEVMRLKAENEILKKAAAYFARESL